MTYRASVGGETFRFEDLRALLGRANEPKSGDQLAGLGAASHRERIAAKMALADVRVSDIVETELVDDEVTAALGTALEPKAYAELKSLSIGELREVVLDPAFASRWEAGLSRGIAPEVAAAMAKIMGSKDLALVASRLHVRTRCRTTMGGADVLGVRIQPNHPTDDPVGVTLSVVDGLRHACGDAMIGINPAEDATSSVVRLQHLLADIVDRLGVPTQTCVLAHVTSQLSALAAGAPVDLLFQSVAGTAAANRSFGIDLALLAEGRDAVVQSHRARAGQFIGEQVMYFETGQGSALSSDSHEGLDQVTLEARAQAVARLFDPYLVNTVVGFIGPEYLADARQIARAGLEDLFTGKVQGLPMGIDVCYTNHVDADQDTNDQLLMLAALAGASFVMGVPGGDDVMLGYQSTSFQDVTAARELTGRTATPEFQAWYEADGRSSVRELRAVERLHLEGG